MQHMKCKTLLYSTDQLRYSLEKANQDIYSSLAQMEKYIGWPSETATGLRSMQLYIVSSTVHFWTEVIAKAPSNFGPEYLRTCFFFDNWQGDLAPNVIFFWTLHVEIVVSSYPKQPNFELSFLRSLPSSGKNSFLICTLILFCCSTANGALFFCFNCREQQSLTFKILWTTTSPGNTTTTTNNNIINHLLGKDYENWSSNHLGSTEFSFFVVVPFLPSTST